MDIIILENKATVLPTWLRIEHRANDQHWDIVGIEFYATREKAVEGRDCLADDITIDQLLGATLLSIYAALDLGKVTP